MPKLSVVLAVYNGAGYIKPAVESILDQSFRDFEFIIVDDGSTDETPAILKTCSDRRIIIITQENKGQAAAANAGIMKSSAEYIARMDADDISDPGRFEKQLDFLENNQEYILVGGYLDVITAGGKRIYTQKVPLANEEIKKNLAMNVNPFLHASVMFRRRAALECGLYNEFMRSFEDLEFFIRLSEKGSVANLPICLGQYRLSEGANTLKMESTFGNKQEILVRARGGLLNSRDKTGYDEVVRSRHSRKEKALYSNRVALAYLYEAKDVQSARVFLFRSILQWPFKRAAWTALIKILIPDKVKSGLKRMRQL